MPDVTFTVDGKKLTAPAGTLLIEACRKAGIEIPAFCYYPGLSLQAACRMCVVRQEKVPKLQTACTTTVAEGQVFITESPEIAQARKATIELLLGNHPARLPRVRRRRRVRTAGHDLQVRRRREPHTPRPSTIATSSSGRPPSSTIVRAASSAIAASACAAKAWTCGRSASRIAASVPSLLPMSGDRLDCEQCGMCIDVCPVGALTSGSYRYKTRPWEMNHVSTVCTHCGDGCKVTLGVRQANDGSEIVRADNRDKSGINGDFLCAKGRFGFDFVESPERLTTPLVRNTQANWSPSPGSRPSRAAAAKLKEIRDTRGGDAIGVIGSNHTTNEENYLLQKFARTVLRTNNIDHDRTTDYASFARALAGHQGKSASLREIANAPAILLIGGDPTNEHPLLAWNLRTNVRLNRARLYIANEKQIKLERQAKASLRLPHGGYAALAAYLGGSDTEVSNAAFRDAVLGEETLVVIFGEEYRGSDRRRTRRNGASARQCRSLISATTPIPAAPPIWACCPTCCPATSPFLRPAHSRRIPRPAQHPRQESAAKCSTLPGSGELGALLVVGANPLGDAKLDRTSLKKTFLIVQDIFLTETAALADVVFPAASLYEKAGTVTNTFGDLQMVRKAADRAGVKPDFEILVRLAASMGADVKKLVPFGTRGVTGRPRPVARRAGGRGRPACGLARGQRPRTETQPIRSAGAARRNRAPGSRLHARSDESVRRQRCAHRARLRSRFRTRSESAPNLVNPAHNGLFTSGTLGRYSNGLKELKQHQASGVGRSGSRLNEFMKLLANAGHRTSLRRWYVTILHFSCGACSR